MTTVREDIEQTKLDAGTVMAEFLSLLRDALGELGDELGIGRSQAWARVRDRQVLLDLAIGERMKDEES